MLRTMRIYPFNIIVLLFVSCQLLAQGNRQANAAEILQQIQQLNVVGSALYIAAHPDDENTRLISYLSNEEKVRTAYLSLTRGDGGQNLIGPELREKLGVIRTQELLSARRIDGGLQFFTRANDFGYSKRPKETLQFWKKKEVLADIVWVIRNFKPDVIINRFDHRTPGTTHGHHTTSAMLSVEAFDLAADPNAFPEQLKYVAPWQPKRLFFNTSWWFYGSREKFEKADKRALTSVDIGVYFPLKGRSNNEIAAMARSQHKCQGFGRALDRGEQSEYLELVKGEWPIGGKGIFKDEEVSWNRLEEGLTIGQMIDILINRFEPTAPEESIPLLLEVRHQIANLPNPHWRTIKLNQVDQIIKQCLGLYVEATVDQETANHNDAVEVTLETIIRRPTPKEIRLEHVAIEELDIDTLIEQRLGMLTRVNQDFKWFITGKVRDNVPYSSPYWLRHPWSEGMYRVPDQLDRGKAENEATFTLDYTITIGEDSLHFTEPVQYKKVDPAVGEMYHPFALVPPVSIHFKEPNYVFSSQNARTIELELHSFSPDVKGRLSFQADKGWAIEPQEVNVQLFTRDETIQIPIQVSASRSAKPTNLQAIFTNDNGKSFRFSVDILSYDHIRKQYVMLPASTKLVPLHISRKGDRIGYIMGAGDAIPEALRQVGYQVDLLDESQCKLETLSSYDAVVLGIRAYNTVDWLARKQAILFDYIAKGGTLVTQYNTSYRLLTDSIAPYTLRLSRDRVTDETAPLIPLDKKHPVLRIPNKLEEEDFDNWVQERGLYFAGEWDRSHFTAIFRSHDKGEQPTDGSLLVASYGKGIYVYSGISFFRQLPAGVPGAYRLFANILALSQSES